MLILRTLRVLSVVLLVAVAPTGASAEQADVEDVRAGAHYAEAINRLTQRFFGIVDLSVELDDISAAIADGHLSAEQGRDRGTVVIADMRRAFEAVLADAAAVGPPPQFDDPRFRRAAETLQAGFMTVRADTDQAITDSIELFEAALAGDPEIVAALERRQFDNTLRSIANENQTIATTLSNLPTGNPAHAHFRVVAELNLSLMHAMRALRPVLDGQPVDSAGLDAADARLAESRRLISEARLSLRALLLRLRIFGPPADVGDQNAEAFLEAMRTFDASLDVEAAMADEVEAMIVALADPVTAGTQAFGTASVRLAALGEERAALMFQRQQLFQDLR